MNEHTQPDRTGRTTSRVRTCFCWASTVLAIAVWSSPLSAQTADLDRARNELPAALFAELEPLLQSSAEEGLPIEPLVSKALEGSAKGVPPARILPAVQSVAGFLRDARLALGPETRPPVLVAAADALRRGVPTERLPDVGRGDRASMALVVLGDLVESGVPVDDAVGVVREAVSRQAAEESMLAIPSAVRSLIRDGQSARSAADAIRRALRDGRPIRDLPSVRGGDVPLGAPVPPGSDPVTRDRRGGGELPH